MSRADDLIERLQSRIVELEGALDAYESWDAKQLAVIHGLNDELAALKAKPSAGVVLPDCTPIPGPLWRDARHPYGDPLNAADIRGAEMFNLALYETGRLNPCRAGCAGAECSATDGVSHSAARLAEHEAVISASRAQEVKS